MSKATTPSTGDRLPPHDPQTEMAVIGCCLMEPDVCIGQCLEKMRGRPEMFYLLPLRTLFNTLREMFEEHAGIDLITVQARLAAKGVLEQIGGISYLSQLQDAVPSAANLPAYLEQLRGKFLLRQALKIAQTMEEKIWGCEKDVDAVLVAYEAEISKLTEEETPQVEEHIKGVMQRVVSDMEQWHYSRGSQQIRGLPTGPPGVYLDKVLQGIRETHYVVLAGRPGDGKSSKAMNIVEYLASDYVWHKPTGKKVLKDAGEGQPPVEVDETVEVKGIPVGVFTIEMDNESLGYRLVFGRAGVDEAQFNQGYAKKGDHEKLARAALDLAKCDIYLDDTPGQSINQIAAKARRMARQHGIKLFVLDYLQLCTSDDPRDDERTRLNKISKKIMALKKQLGVPWLVLAQMNRNIETAERDRAPVLSDLAGSGSIEQDADKVIILKRTPRREIEKPRETATGEELPSDQELIDRACGDWEWSRRPRRVDCWVVKNRRGPTGKAEEIFQNNLCRFEDRHLWMVSHGLEERKAGESKHFGAQPQMPTDEEMNA